jgi:putative membrane protein
MQSFLLRWFVTTIAVAAAAEITGMHAVSIWSLLGMALFLGIINALVRPILLLLSLPFIVVTLGFFILIINALVFELSGWLVPGFYVGGFWRAFFGSIIVSVVSWLLNSFFRGHDGRYYTISRQAEMKQVEGRVVK